MIEQFLIPRLQHQVIKSGYNDPSSWKVLETVLSNLNDTPKFEHDLFRSLWPI